MNEEKFFSCQREMKVSDWLCERGFKMKEAIQIIFFMDVNKCGLAHAIIDWKVMVETQDLKMLQENQIDKQPNCS